MEKAELAARYIQSTNRHIFLSGKAGTGKTTFLRQLAKNTHKRILVVAPTGIAAINAGGTTIHSQFLLPIGTFLPVRELDATLQSRGAYNAQVLVRKNPLNRDRRHVLNDIDVLVIDEVSMLRPDVLDAVAFRLQHARKRHDRPFGGVQLLLIGDLFQLPPVIREAEWELMREHYHNLRFYASTSLQQAGFLNIDLDKVYRQQDERFIGLLNRVRNGCSTTEDLQLLNSHYRPFQDRLSIKDTITVTTHNRRADQINEEALRSLPGDSAFLLAEVEGDFPPSMYPVDRELEIKVGAQVMFIKNDTQRGKFFNGKLAIVKGVYPDAVEVLPLRGSEGEQEPQLRVEPEVWQNQRYVLDDHSKDLHQETIGTFRQYPFRLAWAITVHKSQGLTFDKAVIDVGEAFAPGQVYVALSRLRSLDGLILGTRITERAISVDDDLERLATDASSDSEREEALKEAQHAFLQDYLSTAFHWSDLREAIAFTERRNVKLLTKFPQETAEALAEIDAAIGAEQRNLEVFRRQVSELLQTDKVEVLVDRLQKARQYYVQILRNLLETAVRQFFQCVSVRGMKAFAHDIEELELRIGKKAADIIQAPYLAQVSVDGTVREEMDQALKAWNEMRTDLRIRLETEALANTKEKKSRGRKEPRAKKSPTTKGETYRLTYEMLGQGLSPETIAEQRGLSLSTIESHITRGLSEGRLDLNDYMDSDTIREISTALETLDPPSHGAIVHHLGQRYRYAQVSMVAAYKRFLELQDPPVGHV